MPTSQISKEKFKKSAAKQALDYLIQRNQLYSCLGIGTGSTVDCFIEELAHCPTIAEAYVSSSSRSTQLLKNFGLPVISPGMVNGLQFYIDGADEIDSSGCMIKGGGGALTQEKIIAEMSEEYLCIATSEKEVSVLGKFSLPIELIHSALPLIMSKLSLLNQTGISAKLRLLCDGKMYLTDNGHPIVDVAGLIIEDPTQLEQKINNWPGVVTVGLFARRRADRSFLGGEGGVICREYK